MKVRTRETLEKVMVFVRGLGLAGALVALLLKLLSCQLGVCLL